EQLLDPDADAGCDGAGDDQRVDGRGRKPSVVPADRDFPGRLRLVPLDQHAGLRRRPTASLGAARVRIERGRGLGGYRGQRGGLDTNTNFRPESPAYADLGDPEPEIAGVGESRNAARGE